jgi:hypothetical protein
VSGATPTTTLRPPAGSDRWVQPLPLVVRRLMPVLRQTSAPVNGSMATIVK